MHQLLGVGTTTGISIIVDPYGRVSAMGEVNKREIIIGETFTTEERTIYTRFGDWFGILVSILLVLGVGFGILRNRR